MIVAARPDAPHVPVLLDRVAGLLADAPPGVVVDATLGAGGHAAEILRRRAARHGAAALVGLDRDPQALAIAGERLEEVRRELSGDGAEVSVTLARTRFDALGSVLDDLGVGRVSAILLDLGISSMHVDRPERGFSYRQEGPLDMRMGPDAPRTADEVVNTYERDRLAGVLRRYGDERFAGRIASAIVRARPLRTTTELAAVVREAIPAATRRTGGHPATRTFQALRIEVNGELEALERVLPVAIGRLTPGGILAVLAYHSSEDRLVKRAFADAAAGCICPPGLPVCACGRVPLVDHVVRRPERPADDEVAANPRAASALLRVVRRADGPQEDPS